MTQIIAPEARQTWSIDTAHTAVHFSVKHLMIATVRGRLDVTRGGITWDGQDPETMEVDAEIAAASIDTGVGMRDDHLRSADFLDAENHPVIRFRTTRAERLDDETGKLYGELEIRGVTRPVVLDVELTGETTEEGRRKVGARAVTKIDRTQWGLTWNGAVETGGVLVGDTLKVEIDVQAIEGAA